MPTEDAPLPLSGLLETHPPGSPCLEFGDRRWTYGELAAEADALAAHLTPLTGERVALMLPNCPEAVLTYLACFRSGAVAAPLNTRYAPAEVEAALRRLRPRWLIVHERLLNRLGDVPPSLLAALRVLVVGGSELFYEPFAPLHQPGEHPTGPRPSPDAPALLFLTSGSTGTPKGVVHTQRSAYAMLTSTSAAMGDVTFDDVLQVCDPLAHVSGFIETMTAFAAGATVVLLDGFDLEEYVAALVSHRPTLVCTHIDILARLARAPTARPEWFAPLRGVYTGGDIVPAPLQRDFLSLSGKPIGVGWGMTEAIWLTVDRTPRPDRDGCIGTPVEGVEVRADESGELLVRGPMVMSGYWEDEALTAQSFTDGWFHTGDLGSQDAEGVWWFKGRLKDLIVRRTSKITPAEVEAAIDRHPDVESSAVVAAPDDVEGQVPVAFVVPVPGRPLTPENLTEHLRRQIAAYKLPARIHLLDRLPLTTSGKIDHRVLRRSV